MRNLRKLWLKSQLLYDALVAQLDRAFDCGSKGQGFEFLRAHHLYNYFLTLLQNL